MNETIARELETWPPRIESAVARCGQHIHNYTIISSVSSTQDTARQLNAPPGTAIIAGQQTAGRGRFGRSWSGEPGQGTYVTIILQWNDAPRLAIACAVAVTDTLRSLAQNKTEFGIKWPNDVLARPSTNQPWKKISGVLVEQFNSRAVIGIGINVHQQSWPDELADRAISLHQLGIETERIAVIESLLLSLNTALSLDDKQLVKRFVELDMMTGCHCSFTSGGEKYTGQIIAIDPQRGLSVLLDGEQSPRWFDADRTTLHDLPFSRPS